MKATNQGAPTDVQEAPGFLAWCIVLHAFTHGAHVVLLPLYLAVQEDLGLPSVAGSTLLMTILMVAYFLPSYNMGVLADRYDRRWLLGIGLLISGLGFVFLGMAPSFPWAVVGAVLAGLGGSFYHPASTGLISHFYPTNQGRAFGLVGIGANLGLLLVPLYSGWQLDRLGAELGSAAWRRPVLELGGLAVVVSLLFLVATRRWKIPHATSESKRHGVAPDLGLALWLVLAGTGLMFSLRDFAGTGMGSLGALFMQQAHGFSATKTGVAVSAIFLAGIISNPLFGKLSDRNRFGWIAFVLGMAGFFVWLFPFLPRPWLIPGLLVYGFFFMACYPMVEAALMEAVPAPVRGRIFGAFILISGLLGNISHWLIGRWVQSLGRAAEVMGAYRPGFWMLGALVWFSLLGLVGLRMLRVRLRPATETATSPGTNAIR